MSPPSFASQDSVTSCQKNKEALSIGIIGCGSIGSQIGIQLSRAGYTVYGIRRNTGLLPSCIKPIGLDLNADAKHWPTLPTLNYYLIALTPDQKTPEGYLNTYFNHSSKLLHVLEKQNKLSSVKKFFFLSSTVIYGQSSRFIDEETQPNPMNWRAEIILKTEHFLSENVPVCLINSSGIYGGSRWSLLDRAGLKNQPIKNLDQYGNRIHQDDLSSFIAQLIASPNHLPRYILSDDTPSTNREIFNWLKNNRFPVSQSIIKQLELPPQEPVGKRLSNRRLKSHYALQYPCYQKGYASQLKPWQDWQTLTTFQRQVLEEVKRIPWGKTMSYKTIAEHLQSKAFRAVGQALKINPYAPIIPCHRVIASDGSIGGFKGSRGKSTTDEKRKLLALEQVFI